MFPLIKPSEAYTQYVLRLMRKIEFDLRDPLNSLTQEQRAAKDKAVIALTEYLLTLVKESE
jgi:hypothetical protein